MRLFALTFSLALIAAPALAEDLQFTLVNDSSYDLQELYVSETGADTWGPDILGQDILEAGMQATVTIADGLTVCDYDLRFVVDDGSETTGTQNLCELDTFTLHD